MFRLQLKLLPGVRGLAASSGRVKFTAKRKHCSARVRNNAGVH